MIAEIIGVGAALAEDGALAANTRLLEKELGTCGIEVGASAAVGTSVQSLRAAIARALGRSDVVILMGGLGPGPDGIAKETVCEGLSRRLVMHEPSLKRMKEAYERAGRQMPQQVARLAMMPEQSVVFPGVRGVTPGCALSAGNQFLLMVPEDPREFVPMFQHSVMPYLAKFSDAAVVTRTVGVYGPDEKEMREKLGPILRSQNPAVAVYPRRGEFQVRVTARAADKAQASAICAPVVKEIEKRLGEAVFGVDCGPLPQVAAGLLAGAKLTVSLGEACTGGSLGELLSAAPGGAGTVAYGVSAYSDRIKQDSLGVSAKLLKKYGPVSPQTAAAMAQGAMEKGKSALGLAVTGNAGGRGEDAKRTGTVHIALCDAKEVWTRSLSLPKDTPPEAIRYAACLAALDLVRLYITALPGRLPGGAPLKDAAAGRLSAPAAAGAKGEGPGAQKKKRGFLAAVFPARGDAPADVVRKLILIVAVCVFIGSAAYLVSFYGGSAKNRSQNEEIAKAYSAALGIEDDGNIEVPDGYPAGYQKKFANLYQINEDVAGWLSIDGTQVNYPVVHYIDNSYYLRRDFYRKDNKYGIPWLEANDSMEPQSDNYIIYGHNMTDGQMFGELMKYKGASGTKDFANPTAGIEYLREHPVISFDDVYRDNDYKIMAVFITNAKEAYGPIFYYNTYLDLGDQATFNTFVDEITSRSYYSSNVDVQFGDKFLMLSTCSYEFGPVSDDAHVRTVVVGRRVRDGEKADGSDITYSVNQNVKLPAGFAGGQATAEAVKNAKTESAAGLVPELPGASAAASAGASGAAGGSSAAASPSSSQSAAQTEYDDRALGYADDAQYALKKAREARDEAQNYLDRAGRGSAGASEARGAADKAAQAMDRAKQAYYDALDASDLAREIYEKHPSGVTKQAYQDALAAANSAKKEFEKAEQYADEAESIARDKEKESASSSSSTASTVTPPASSEAAPPPASSETPPPPPASSETAASSEAPPPSEPEPEPEPEPSPESSQPVEETGGGDEGGEGETQVAAATVRSSANDKLTIVTGGKKTTGRATDIVARVVMNEMGAGFEEEAIKAQAVAAYTFIKQQNKSGITPYLGTRTPSDEVYDAVEEVAGEAVYYKNKLAFTPFYATSAGVTIASEDVWGGSYPYLVSVDSEIDEMARNYEVSVKLSADAVAKKVKSALKIDLYDYSDDPDDWFDIEDYTEGGMYVKSVRVGRKTVTGRVLRENVLGLRSAAFEIDYSSRRDEFTFTTYGYGHGVGMSQTGANLYAAEEGWDYLDILKHYYPGTKVK
ncbi:nicotinamide-nucleotide amidohydrolase family protein [Anaerotruncus massiliensis (ex Togo et al. 2019)]|nr:nicotinamide-nucleotide amidohydrolase family protein [Anaerotruncus massiliensis (ex Togo et al. 2019)]GKH48388.1 hypothetical protein CE91St45_29500 [Oscillospiraceae bacterium]